MKGLVLILGIYTVLFCKCINLEYCCKYYIDQLTPIYTQEAEQSPAANTNSLTYKLVNEIENSVNKLKVNLILRGNEYTAPKKCYIKKSNDQNSNLEDISTCTNGEANNENKCVRPCNGEDNKLEFDKFSPRTKYVVVFTDENTSAAKIKTNGGAVFGLELPLLVNPQVTITTHERKLKLSTITCKQVKCPIFYKNVKYADGAAVQGCVNPTNVNEVEFDLMIPHYEMRCDNYPSFFYKLQNNYTLSTFDVYKPQYYITYSSTQKDKYLLKFTNKFSFEICRFSIRDHTTAITENSTNDYKSNCGSENKDCYAPCNNVELVFKPSKSVVQILIQTRYASLAKTGTKYFGYIQDKLVVTETTAAGTLLSDFTPTGVTLNINLFKPDEDVKFASCTVTYYEADKPLPTNLVSVKCSVGATPVCDTGCTTALTIKQLGNGKPYILEITAQKQGSSSENFKEHIFIRTEKSASLSFSETKPTITETTTSITAVDGTGDRVKTDHTCAYYISPRGKDVYVCAMCQDSYPCRGYCKDTQNIVGLKPGTEYDLKVVAHSDYGYKVHEIKTAMSTLTLQSQFLDKGFKLIGALSTPDPTAVCHYKVQVKKGEKFELVHECPAAPQSTNKRNPRNKSASKILIARSAEGQQPKDATSSNRKKTIPSCTQPPLCTNIIFHEGYEAEKEYRVLVTAVGRSEETSIDISIYPIPTATTDITKQLISVITRDERSLHVMTTLPSGVEETSLCKWELRDWADLSKPIVKKCMNIGDEGCSVFPPCKEFTIENVDDTTNYRLVLFHSTHSYISGSAEIKQGEKSNKSTIVAVIVPVLIIILGAGFYFGYWKNKS